MWFQRVFGIVTLIMSKVCDMTRVPLTNQQRLLSDLFENYEKSLRPVNDTGTVINVTLNPGLFSIVETDEASESITIAQSFRMTWSDIFLTWDPSEYGGMVNLMLPLNKIWYPDVVYLNMIDISVNVPDDRNYVSIDYDGTVLATIDEVVTLHCKYRIHMFPFDTQNCTMHIGSWMFTGDEMDLFYSTPTDLDQYNNNTEWDLISLTARRVKSYFSTSSTTWVDVYYDLVIQRKPTYYLLTFVLPCVIIISVSIIGIFAPFSDAGEREEKVTMGLTTLLTMAVILTIVTDQMPKSSEGMPLLALYIMIQVAITAISSLVSVYVMYQQRKWAIGEAVPDWILAVTFSARRKVNIAAETEKHIITPYSPLSTRMTQLMGMMYDIRSMMRQIIEHMREHNAEEQLKREWQRIAHRLDVFSMLVFLLLNFLFTLAFLCIGYTNLKS